MSYHTWHIYGYGIKTSDITDLTVEKLRNFIHLAPLYKNAIKQRIKERSYTDLALKEYIETDENESYGLAGVIKEVIFECEGIDLTACDDFDGNEYLLYEPIYPWYMNETDKTLTPENLSHIFKKYLRYLTDKEIEIAYYTVANGG